MPLQSKQSHPSQKPFLTKARAPLSRREFAGVVGLGLIGAPYFLFGQSRPAAPSGITLDYNGPPADLDEVVLFPFDDYAIPFRYQLQMGLVPGKGQADPHTHVLEQGPPGSVDANHVQFYGSI